MSKFITFIIATLVCSNAFAFSLELKPTYSSHDLSTFSKWNAVLDRMKEQKPIETTPYNDFIISLNNISSAEKIKKVNDYFNSFQYVEDRDNWGVEDYWETPFELIAKGGDCEDYAIAKYMALRDSGIPIKNLKLTVVNDMNNGGVIHMVLIVSNDGRRYLLDNQIKQIVDISKVSRYRIIYTINEQVWEKYI